MLEEFLFDRLPEALAVQVEEHLLVCPSCQDSLIETERFISALKIAAEHPDPAPALEPLSSWRRVLKDLPRLATARTSLAPALVLAILLLLVVRKPQELPPPVPVNISSLRGANVFSPAPAGRTLQLTIDAPGLRQKLDRATVYQMEVVDALGTPVWKGVPTEKDGKLTALLPKLLVRGIYWVRLYDGKSELLQEFGLSAN